MRVDTAIAKLLWIEQGRHKSRRDLRHLFQTAPPPQQRQIEELARELETHELLAAVLEEWVVRCVFHVI